MSGPRCICGCGRHRHIEYHHAVYQQALRRLTPRTVGPPDSARIKLLLADGRNLVPVSRRCHAAHHSRSRPLELRMLPDSVFEFAREEMGAAPAYEYLSRRYRGGDDRLDALLISEEKDAA